MQLENLSVELRPRNPWEALDLGCVLVRRWWRPLYVSWLMTAAPVFLLVAVTLFEHPTVAALLLWWLKPLYERAPLMLLSSAIFGEEPTFRGAWSSLGRALRPQLLAHLTWRRFAPTRAFDTPVAVLEGLGGERRRRRLAVLQRTAGGPAFWLTVIGVHVEAFLGIALLLLAVMLVPSQVEIDWWRLLTAEWGVSLDWASNLAAFVAMAAVGPVYVACGFTLYLNRRIELEGWDIELRFRALARRSAGVAAAAALALGVVEADPAHAAVPESPEASRALIDEVLAGEAFHQPSVTRVPRFMEGWFDGEEHRAQQPLEMDWLTELAGALAYVAEFVLWLGAAVLLVMVVRWLARYRGFGSRTREEPSEPAAVFHLDLDPDSLPERPLERARSWWDRGRRRDALALLYRATLVRLEAAHGVGIEAGDTEGECLAKARRGAPALAGEVLDPLTRVWLAAGYAGRFPGEPEFLALLTQCERVVGDV